MNTDTLTKRRDLLQNELDAYVRQANQQIASIEGRIAEIDYLLGEMAPKEEAAEKPTEKGAK